MMKEYSINDDIEFGVDSRYRTKKEKDADAVSLMELRLQRMKQLPFEQVVRAKLMQLKLKMEDYLEQSNTGKHQGQFTIFLEAYIDSIYPKRGEFAEDVNITPVLLSQIINQHREPGEEFMLKLMLHSAKAFKSIAGFQKEIWYQVYFQDKISNTLANQHQWKPKIEKQVRLRKLVEK